ncbi:hypothetical protein Q7A53_06650 [Halobacillus rhizosphaerae]|uniref:hypothetical protein n=1 Tax=Halobacillus rhizosphaerae TaxID=3064889 RepID=UPI00398A9218
MKQETILIEGSYQGMKFSKTIELSFEPAVQSIEEAILSFYNSETSSFEELASRRGWRNCYWTYAQPVELVI